MNESPLLERLWAKRGLPPPAERRNIREAAKASLRDVAAELGTSAAAVHRWEQGADPRRRTAAYAALLEELRQIAP